MNATPTAFAIASPSAFVRMPPVTRREQLRLELLASVDFLHLHRADLVSEGFVEDHVALR